MKLAHVALALSASLLGTAGSAAGADHALSGESLTLLDALAHCPSGTLEALMEGADGIGNGTVTFLDGNKTYMVESRKVVAYEPMYLSQAVNLLSIHVRPLATPRPSGFPTPISYTCSVTLVGP